MYIGPIHSTLPGMTTGYSPVKPIKVSSATGKQVVLFDAEYPYGLQSDVMGLSVDTVFMEASQSLILARIHQLEELAQNQAWSGRPGIYIQWREDGVVDGEDGFYVLKGVDVSEEYVFSGYGEPKIDVDLRRRYSPAFGVFVDSKAVPNDANLNGTTLAAFPQGLASVTFPAPTFTLAAADGSTINVVENPPIVMRAQLLSGPTLMTAGRCAVMDSI